MSTIKFDVSYQYGEYFTPLDLIKILMQKTENFNLCSFCVSLMIFLPVLFLSVTILPFYYINKLFCFLNSDFCDLDFIVMIVHFIMYLINIFYFITFWIYKILCFIEHLFCIAFQSIPPKTNYKSKSIIGDEFEYF